MAKQSLLVVDADPRSQHILEVALRKAGFAVTTAADGAEALRKVQRSPPDLVLSELSLPGQDGAALCRALRGDARLGGTPVLLMNADRAQPTREAALQAGADDFLVKPLLIKELVARIRTLLTQREQARYAQRGAAAALTGSVSDLGLVDLFTSLENWQKTAVVLCESGDGRTARVWVRDGHVVDAEVDPIAGEAAFYRLLTWESGSFRVEFGPVDREARSEAGTQALLMEGMRRIDEIARLGESLPMSTVLGVDFPHLASQLAEMPDELNGVLRLFDGHRSLREVLSGSPVDDLSTMAAVQRLMGEGVLISGTSAGPQRPKPSLQEWLGSNPPPPRGSEEAAGSESSKAGTPPSLQVVRTPPPEPPEARAVARPEADGAPADRGEQRISTRSSPPVIRAAGKIALYRYPPLRGTRRERLRREAEEARQAMSAGKPVRLTHVLELPPTPGGADALPQGARRMSVAVGDAAKRFAPDMPVARVVRPWIAPGASEEVEAPGAPGSPAEPEPPTARAQPAAGGAEEIKAAIADSVAVATPAAGTFPLVAPALPAATPAARVERAGVAPPVVRALRPKAPAAVASPSPAAAAEPRPRNLLRFAVACFALLALSAAAVIWLRSHRAPSAPPSEAPPAPPAEVTAAPAPPPAPANVPAEPPAPAPPAGKASGSADPGDYSRALSSGEALLKRGKYRAAVAEFRKAVDLRPDSVPALLALGDAYLEGDQLRNAVKPLREAAQLDPKNARVQLLLGTVFQGLGREKDAVLAYKRYLELEPHGEFAGDVRAIVANLSK